MRLTLFFIFNDAKISQRHLLNKKQKPLKFNYLIKICDVKMYLAKLKDGKGKE